MNSCILTKERRKENLIVVPIKFSFPLAKYLAEAFHKITHKKGRIDS